MQDLSVPLIISGSEELFDLHLIGIAVQDWIEEHGPINEAISGTSLGMESAAERWATRLGYPVERYVPNWEKHGRRAGWLRQRQMAERAAVFGGGCVVLHTCERASLNLLEIAWGLRLKVLEWDLSAFPMAELQKNSGLPN